jgi:tripartite-type tricarboxylate transporter receptor subunit TctC
MIKFLIAFILSINVAIASELEFTVHHAPGGPSDKITRLLVTKFPGQKYKVINRPGAQGKIAVRHILGTNSMMVATIPQILVTNFLIPVDPGYKEDDLELIYVVGTMPNVLVCNNKLGFKTYKDFLNTTKSLNFGVAGYGSSEHLATEFLFNAINVKQHVIVPYAQGGAASLNDLLAGNIDCMFANYPLVKEHIVEGKRITAFISSHSLNANIPHWQQEFKEQFPFQGNLGIVVSKRLNPAIKEEMIKDVERILDSDLRDEIKEIGIFPIMKSDQKSIQDVFKQNNQLKNLINKHKIRIY